LKGAERIDIDRRCCKGCMLCKYICPFDVFEPGQTRSDLDYLMPRVANLENCRVCGLCESHCPDMCITVVAKKKGKEKE
jgi:2-oxoglutarate ferredoxin oxidoreductase subunit delta